MGNRIPTVNPGDPRFKHMAEQIDDELTLLHNNLSGLVFDASGTTAGRAAYDGEAAGFTYFDEDLQQWFQKLSATSGDWSGGVDAAAPATEIKDKNLMINGGFDIWQTETSWAITTTVFTRVCDMWQAAIASGASTTFSRGTFAAGQVAVPGNPTYFMQMNRLVVGSGASVLSHRVEDVNTYNAQEITLTFWAKSTASHGLNSQLQHYYGVGGSTSVFAVAKQHSLTTVWQKFSQVVTLPSSSGKTLGTGHALTTRFNWLPSEGATETVSIARVSISLGDTSGEGDPFPNRPVALEWALCQRYYQTSYRANVAPGTASQENSAQIHHYDDIDTQRVGIRFPVRLRSVAPTVTIYNPASGVTNSLEQVGAADVTNTGPWFIGDTGCFITFVATAGSYARFHWTADARL